jgi:hypothetical protein
MWVFRGHGIGFCYGLLSSEVPNNLSSVAEHLAPNKSISVKEFRAYFSTNEF